MAKILVVDDEERIVKFLSKLLSKNKFEVLTTAKGADCLSLAQKEMPDLILLDVMMPEMDGGEVAQNLLGNEKTKNIPIIFLTGIVTEKEVIESKGKIANRIFVSKFSDSNELIKKIKEVLGTST